MWGMRIGRREVRAVESPMRTPVIVKANLSSVGIQEDGPFQGLMKALRDGWKIDPPIYERPRWGLAYAGQNMYHFILRRGASMTMVSVAESPHLYDFLDQHPMTINRSR